MSIRIGTRGSQLALAQAGAVADRLRRAGHDAELVVIETAGDRQADRRFADIGAPGVFVREIEAALLANDIDMAVHSYKDLPSRGPDGLVVAAVPERRDPADRLIARPEFIDRGTSGRSPKTAPPVLPARGPGAGAEVQGLLPLRPGVRVGTASARRRALLWEVRPDLQAVTLRGNVPTRVDKLRAGEAEAVILAAAGLERLQGVLDLDGLVTPRLDPALFVPAPAQGAIALQCRRDDPVEKALAGLHDEAVAFPVRAERELLRRVEGGCDLPFGAWCRSIEGGMLELIAILEIGGAIVRESRRGNDPGKLAARVWDAFVAAGARRGTASAAELSKGGEGSEGGERGDGSKGSQGEQDGDGVYHEMVAGPGEAGSRNGDAAIERGD